MKDYGLARANYQKGCDGSYPSGCSYLGDLYRTGHGVPKDIAHGRQLLQKELHDLGDQWGCDEVKEALLDAESVRVRVLCRQSRLVRVLLAPRSLPLPRYSCLAEDFIHGFSRFR